MSLKITIETLEELIPYVRSAPSHVVERWSSEYWGLPGHLTKSRESRWPWPGIFCALREDGASVNSETGEVSYRFPMSGPQSAGTYALGRTLLDSPDSLNHFYHSFGHGNVNEFVRRVKEAIKRLSQDLSDKNEV